jgi:hypothetical protein
LAVVYRKGALRQMKLLTRYIIQFFAGLGMDLVSTGAYFLLRDSYMPRLPNLYGSDQSEYMGAHAVIVMLALFVFFQIVAYAGMRVAIKPERAEMTS